MSSLVARLVKRLAPRVKSVQPDHRLKVGPLHAPAPAGRFVSGCSAHDADTGLRCRLLSGHAGSHRHERGEFLRAAINFIPARRVDEWATRRPGAGHE
jgi:hypothetical protein